MKNLLDKLTNKITLLIMQLIASSILLYSAYTLKILPTKYFIVLVGIVTFCFLITVLFLRSGTKKLKNNKSKFSLFFAKTTSIVLSIILIVASYYVIKGNQFINNLVDPVNESTYVVSVVALKNSEAKTLQDLNKKNFGICYKNNTEVLTQAVAHFENEIGIQSYSKQDDYIKLGSELYDGKVDAIIVSNETEAMIKEQHQDFTKDTKVIASYKVTKVNKVTTIHTDVTEKPFSIYLTGADAGDERSDTNLLVVVNPKTKQILLVSIPRDTQISLHSKKAMDKLTHAGLYGHEELINTVQDFLDVKINYYAKTNFDGITKIVDALGGVTIDSPYAFTTLHGDFEIKKGVQEMDGYKALCFVRERYDLPSGDFDRGRNQQILFKAMLDRATSPKIITNYSNILEAVQGGFSTDMSSDEIKSLISMQLEGMDSWEVLSVQVPGTPTNTYKAYSSYGSKTAINIPDDSSVIKIKEIIDLVESGKKITDQDILGLQ